MLTLWQPLFQNFLLSVNHFLVLIKIHQIVEGNMCLKILYCRTPQPPLVLSVVLGLLDTCLDCVGLEAQIKVMEFTQMGLMRICWSVESVAKYKMLGGVYEGMWPSNNTRLLSNITAITVLQRNNARKILVLKIVRN